MTDLNLPPLHYAWRARSAICVTKESVEARERVFRAEIERLRQAPPAAVVPDVYWLAKAIRTIDGRHSLGAGVLAERIVEAMLAAQAKGVES